MPYTFDALSARAQMTLDTRAACAWLPCDERSVDRLRAAIVSKLRAELPTDRRAAREVARNASTASNAGIAWWLFPIVLRLVVPVVLRWWFDDRGLHDAWVDGLKYTPFDTAEDASGRAGAESGERANYQIGDIVERVEPVDVVEHADETTVQINGVRLFRDDADKLFAPTGDNVNDPTDESER